jgi:hypothetical protein
VLEQVEDVLELILIIPSQKQDCRMSSTVECKVERIWVQNRQQY